MIKTFLCKETEKVFNKIFSRQLPQSIQQAALRKLEILDNAVDINDLKAPPSNKLEKLKGNRCSQHSIRINHQWRVCFEWHENNAYDVEIVDYH
ncbi:MAG: type II toxin-antitoxin system RelE/ParE family toxin [Candidatus Omnitrophica bacterium]|nr:type II toxin-antitoxin system RelE/ParE family toxin [Candidatus Omnitrophota bacterium]